MASADQISCRNLGRQSWASAPTPRGGRGTARRVVVPYGWLRRAAAIARASGAQRSVCASGCEEMGGNCGRDHAQSIQQPWTIPQSRRSRDSSLYTREPLRTGDADCRVASLLAMTVLILCHSEEAQRADVGIRLFYDGRGMGRRAAGSSAPTEGLPKSPQRADVGIGPDGKPNQPPKPAGAQRSACGGGGEGGVEIGEKAINKGDGRHDCRGSA